MSSILSIRQNYEQMRAQATNTYAGRHVHQNTQSTGSAQTAVTDEISISSEGMEALESSRSERVRINPLDELVESGTLTEEQEDAIKAAFDKMGPPHGKPPGGMPPGGMPPVGGAEATSSSLLSEDTLNQLLESLTDNGTITDDQQDAISEALAELINKLYAEKNSTSETNGTSSVVVE